MQLLTPYGYKDLADVNIGDELVAYDIVDGHVFTNVLENKQWFSPDMFSDEYAYDEEGNQTDEIIKTKEEVFAEIHGELKAYKINDEYVLFKNQSVWANLNVCHAQDLKIGDTIYDDDDNDVLIYRVEEVPIDGWWRLTVSGDHSYISDNLTLHNASRYWVGGGASANWNATGNTNWGSASGVLDNASVPTSTDDVFFDSGGNSNSTISATITILSLTIDSGYTSTMTHNATLTVAGNVTLGANYTIAGTSGLTISATSTITSNGKTWPNAMTFSTSSTKTLVGNLNVSGLFTSATTTQTVNKTTSEVMNFSGGMTINGTTSGSADIYLKGGTWSGSGAISNNLYIDGSVTVSGTVTYAGSTFTYLSGSVTTAGSTVTFSGSPTITSGSITWNNVTFSTGNQTKTLVGDLNVSGLFTANNSTQTINKTTSEVINANGGLTMSGTTSGTADIYLKGGTWSGTGAMFNNLYIDGNVTVSGSVRSDVNFIHLSGVVNTYGSTITFAGITQTITSGTMRFFNVILTSTSTKTLVNNFNIDGTLTVAQNVDCNKTTDEVINCFGYSASAGLSGTADVYLKGGLLGNANGTNTGSIVNNFFIDGNITIISDFRKQGGTLRYLSGKVTLQNGGLILNANTTVLGFDKVPLASVTITGTITATIDRFFTGSPLRVCQVVSTSATANYTIVFTDNFEKIGRNVAVSGCTLARPNQLVLITNPRFNTNRGTNIGVRYVNQSPNGFPRNRPSITDTMTSPAMGLASDPNFTRQG